MAISDTSLRSTIWSTIYTGLNAANITASDASSSSISLSYKAVYGNKKSDLPQAIIHPVEAIPETLFFDNAGDAFSSIKEVRVLIDIYASRMPHIDQFSDKVINYFETNKIVGLPLIGWDEDYEIAPQNENRVHMKSLMLTFRRG